MNAKRPGAGPGRFGGRPYRGAALMAKDSDALAYQAAALSDTARGPSLRRPDFLDRLWRLADLILILLTLAPLRFVPCFSVSRVQPTPLSHIWNGPLGRASAQGWSTQSEEPAERFKLPGVIFPPP